MFRQYVIIYVQVRSYQHGRDTKKRKQMWKRENPTKHYCDSRNTLVSMFLTYYNP